MTVNPKSASRLANGLLPSIIVFAGLLLTLWIQTYSRDRVLFSGDGGLKAMLAQQIAQQLSSLSLPLDISFNISAPNWVEDIWRQGQYPFTPPYVYQIGSQKFITFPFTFPAVTAPFYALFGDRGLYIVPLLSLWATWLRFIQISKRAAWDIAGLSLGLIAIIFASPLTFYGGTYWEHTLAVALAFWGITAWLFPKGKDYLSSYRILSSGLLIGLSAWFRPEFLCLIAAVILIALIGWLRPKWEIAPALTFKKATILISTMICTVGVFFALNYGIYGHPLGIHSIQVAEESSLSAQISQSKTGYLQLLSSLWRYFPLSALIVLTALISPELKKISSKTAQAKSRHRSFSPSSLLIQSDRTAARCLLALSLLFIFSVPLIVPPGAGGKQWGPRFYLIVVPMLSVVLATQLKKGFFRQWVRRVVLATTALILAISVYTNTVQGLLQSYQHPKTQSVSLAANYELVSPAIAQFTQEPTPWIAISHQFVAQQFWSALPQKTFFRTETIADVEQLADALTAQNEAEFLYVCYPHRDCLAPDAPSDKVIFSALGNYGKYPFYRVEIVK
mgnify:CR=1 FL=1